MIMKGQKISDRYQIIKAIGEGGMANVYLALDHDLDVFPVCESLYCCGRPDIEADDDGTGRSSQHNIGFSHCTYAGMDDLHPYILVVQLFQ